MEHDKVLIKEYSETKKEKEWIKNKIDVKIVSNQIKSKKRVTDHGEVLTPRWLVNDMLDMLPKHTEEITMRYLETAAGEGIFLVEVLKRKLEIILRTYDKQKEIEFYTLVAISNIYGLELLKDNVEVIKRNLKFLVKMYFRERFKIPFRNKFKLSIEKIISLNIINTDSIEGKTPIFLKNNQIMKDNNGKVCYEDEPSHISEWRFEEKKKRIQRVDYIYRDIVEEQKQRYMMKVFEKNEVIDLNEDELGNINWLDKIDNEQNEKKDIEKAKPIKVFEYVDYLEIGEMGDR